MDDKRIMSDDRLAPLDDVLSDLGGAVRSLSDDELRDLLVALLSEWRERREASPNFTN